MKLLQMIDKCKLIQEPQKEDILFTTIICAFCFVMGYASYKTIPDALALSCLESKVVDLELEYVFMETQKTDEIEQVEQNKWPATACVMGRDFGCNEKVLFYFGTTTEDGK